MRRFNNEDIVLSSEASRNLLNALFSHHSNSRECVEFENVSSEDTAEGTVYHFPELDINLNEFEEEVSVITEERGSVKTNIHYQDYHAIISVTHTVRPPSFVNYGNVTDKQLYHPNITGKSYSKTTLNSSFAAAA